jgi:hypothetical protein
MRPIASAIAGWNELEVTGWQSPPHYDADTKHLEWGLVVGYWAVGKLFFSPKITAPHDL